MSLWMLAIAAVGAVTRTTVSVVSRAVSGLWNAGDTAALKPRAAVSPLSTVTILH
jgi:hypothetical protein